ETHGDLGRRDGDDEEGEDLTGHVAVVNAVVGHEGEIHAVQHELDAHELDEDIAPYEEPDGPYRKNERREDDVVLEHLTHEVHCPASLGRPESSRGNSGPTKSCVGFVIVRFGCAAPCL